LRELRSTHAPITLAATGPSAQATSAARHPDATISRLETHSDTA